MLGLQIFFALEPDLAALMSIFLCFLWNHCNGALHDNVRQSTAVLWAKGVARKPKGRKRNLKALSARLFYI